MTSGVFVFKALDCFFLILLYCYKEKNFIIENNVRALTQKVIKFFSKIFFLHLKKSNLMFLPRLANFLFILQNDWNALNSLLQSFLTNLSKNFLFSLRKRSVTLLLVLTFFCFQVFHYEAFC